MRDGGGERCTGEGVGGKSWYWVCETGSDRDMQARMGSSCQFMVIEVSVSEWMQ